VDDVSTQDSVVKITQLVDKPSDGFVIGEFHTC